MTYLELREQQQAEVNAFPMVFAFNQRQLEEGMRQLGLDPSETDQVYKLPYGGGIYRRSDSAKLMEMLDRHQNEMEEAIASDTTGEGFIQEMFECELSNHEYSYTGDASDAISALGLTYEEIAADPRLLYGFRKACQRQQGPYDEKGV